MIPDYQSLMLPLLKLISDGKEHKYRVVIESLASEFQLTDEEIKELLASGKQPIFDNRVGWAKTYLKKAGLLEDPKRATFVITDLGKQILAQNPDRIDAKYLRQFPSFLEFIDVSRDDNGTEEEETINVLTSDQTPEESLEKAYQRIRNSLASEILNKVVELSPTFFERLVVELLVKMGYGGSIKDAGKAIGKSGDEGIDGTIKEDKLGLDIIYIQAKRWKPENVVGRPEIQKFVGALAGQGAKKGIFITTSNFTKEALEYTPKNETKIVLIDGEQLAQLMIDYNLGCTTEQIYELKKIDSDYFGEE
ncbi:MULTISPECIES: restriction endonuclease [Limnospira]|uniref:restriction endonuclease n=1 Tax=Limnospira TaxID=2596745 RepID=UPI0028E12B8A|nr:restriction endonuclease [Limnospira sp. PMC 737.11]MDT9276041.1 restriction endonuclease [Limnospira sp. PMC 737.11]MDY7055236.1 restriction endonuclease [Limnospira fusiformis LS22]